MSRFSKQIAVCDEAIKENIENDPAAKLLMTAPGVGPIIASCFIMAIRDPNRFDSGRSVGAYLGLVPSLYQSGQTCRRGRITKQGNRQARWALTMAASVLISIVTKESPLRSWGIELAKKIGRKKAIVAVARKLAGLLWSMWKNNCEYKVNYAK